MWIGEIDISPLLKVLKKFELFLKNTQTEQERAGIIQAFEYCFELTWKVMKRLLEERGQRPSSPRETFRMAALEGFISDPELWFDFLKKRNLTTHTYQENEAEKVLAICPLFLQTLKLFLKQLGVEKDAY
jgi:nucleotidyltransferase substrate binding protein (TIGR01987 family)